MTLQVSRESFSLLSKEEQAIILYDMMKSISEKMDDFINCHRQHMKDCDVRMKKLESRKFVDRGLAGLMGLIGGFAESLIRWK